MKSFWVDLLVKATLPLGTRWVRKQEAAILREGRPLREWERLWAQNVGVRRPEEVRILPVPRVPTPGQFFTVIFNRKPVFRNDGTCKRVRRSAIYQLKSLFKILGMINVHCKYRAKNFFAHSER